MKSDWGFAQRQRDPYPSPLLPLSLPGPDLHLLEDHPKESRAAATPLSPIGTWSETRLQRHSVQQQATREAGPRERFPPSKAKMATTVSDSLVPVALIRRSIHLNESTELQAHSRDAVSDAARVPRPVPARVHRQGTGPDEAAEAHASPVLRALDGCLR